MNLNALYAAAKRPDAGTGIMFHIPDMGISKAPFPGVPMLRGTDDAHTASDHGHMIASILLSWCPKAAIAAYRVASDIDPLYTNTGRLLDAFDRIIENVKHYTNYRHIVSVSQASALNGDNLERFRAQIILLDQLDALVVCGAGNDGRLPIDHWIKYPARFPEPICVTACDKDGNRAEFSTILNEADCCALGVGVQGIDADGKPMTGNGTSYACPQVAGMAGMIWQPGMTANDVWDRIKAACVDADTPGIDPYYGWGVVDPTRFDINAKEDEYMEFIQKGCYGDAVRQLQLQLMAAGFPLPQFGADGDFGSETEGAVKAFQSAHGLTVNGIVTDLTQAALTNILATPPSAGDYRQRIINRVLDYAALFIGTNYSQPQRYQIWPRGKMDCSSYVAALYAAAGFPLLSSAGAELWTSCYEVNASGFDLVYPDARNKIGKNLPSPAGLLASGICREGDIVFWGLKENTTRSNKITHVGLIDRGAQNIIHISNNQNKCCREPLSKYDRCVCAIIRLRDDVRPMMMPLILSDADERPSEIAVKALQVALNVEIGAQLVIDGCYGKATINAVKAANAQRGVISGDCTKATWEQLGFIIPDAEEETPPPAADDPVAALYRVTGASVNFRRGPGTTFEIEGVVRKDDILFALPAVNGWHEAAAQINNHIAHGYISANYMKEV